MERQEQIDRILDSLRDRWQEHPDYRLGQLLVNALCPPGHPARGEHTEVFFYQSDAGWYEALEGMNDDG